jgi:molybdate transport repressor ModE-like protein
VAVLPDLSSLRLLVDVARLGSIGAAGRAAGISQQSASARLRTMERELGLTLLQRSPTGAALTPQGTLLVEWATDLLHRADEIETALATLRQQRSRQLHVHASMTTAEHLLPGWLVRLRERSPVPVSLHATNTDAVLAAVRSGEADLGFIEGPADLSGLASAVVGSDELVLVAAPTDPWARRRRPLRPEAVAARPLTSREPGSGTRGVAEHAAAAVGVTLAPPEVELTTAAAVLASVAAGGAPAFLSRRVVQRDLAAGTLVAVPVAGLDLQRRFTAVWIGTDSPPRGPVRDLLAIARA